MSLAWLAALLAAAGVTFAALSGLAVRTFTRRIPQMPTWRPAVTILKPLCGDEPEIYENLRSFCAQDYPEFQIVFGVHSPNDTALPAVARLRAEFSDLPIDVVVGREVPNVNPKVANLRAMQAAARHGVLAIADSDIRVGPDYLARIIAPLADEAIGAVTCPYVGRATTPDLFNRLACLYINDAFLPQVLLARALGTRDFCLGATIALTTANLARLGGFDALLDSIAEDYEIGVRLTRLGLKVELSDCLIETTTAEAGFATLLAHELRWARTLRVLRPLGYAFSWLTLPIVVSLLAAAFLGPSLLAAAILALGVALRVALNLQNAKAFGVKPEPWLAILRDLLSFAVWAASYFGREVMWRGQRLKLDRAGRLRPLR